ncbi:hypothetical protein J4444_02115 [Candidatus Woesearchaeota archaeon]|nr:hypothetical protein [Candidatus Woesearchaeota archaeon]
MPSPDSHHYLSELHKIIDRNVGKYKNDKEEEAAAKSYLEQLTRQLDLEDYLCRHVAPMEGPLTPEIMQIADPFERYFARLPLEARPITTEKIRRLQVGHIVRTRYDRMMIMQFIAMGGNILKERDDEKSPRPGKEYKIKSLNLVEVELVKIDNEGTELVIPGKSSSIGIYGFSYLTNEEPRIVSNVRR